MADYSYSGDPSSSTLDEVRFLTGDTNPRDPQLLNAEITYLLASEGSALDAAIAGCIGIAARYSREVDAADETAEGTKAKRQREVLAKHYRDLADDLRRRRLKPVAPYAGGLSVSEKETAELDTDRVQPAFRRDMHRNRSNLAGTDETP